MIAFWIERVLNSNYVLQSCLQTLFNTSNYCCRYKFDLHKILNSSAELREIVLQNFVFRSTKRILKNLENISAEIWGNSFNFRNNSAEC